MSAQWPLTSRPPIPQPDLSKQASVYCSSSQVVKPIKITWDNKCKTELKCHSQQYSKIIKYRISLKYVLPRRRNQQAIDLLGHHAVSSNQIAHSPFSQYFEKYINRCGNNFLFSFINKNQDLTEKTTVFYRLHTWCLHSYNLANLFIWCN